MQIKWARPSDKQLCNDLYNKTYGRNRTAEQWAWEFETPNIGRSLPYALAVQDDELVGTQAYIPVRFVDELGEFTTAKSEETLVAPSMRGKSVLDRMYDTIFQRAREDGHASIWGFTTAEKAFRKLGFDIPCKTKLVILCASPNGLRKLTDTAGGLKRRLAIAFGGIGLAAWSTVARMAPRGRLKPGESLVAMEDAALFHASYTTAFITRWSGCTIQRDAAFIQWRLFDNPFLKSTVLGIVENGRLLGHVAYAVDQNSVGRIVDIMVAHPGSRSDDERLTRILLAGAVDGMRAANAAVMVAMSGNDHPYDRLLRKIAGGLGFVTVNQGTSVVFHTGFTQAKRGSSHDDFKNWFVTMIFTEGQLG